MTLELILPSRKSKEVNGCGWLTKTLWSSGGYNFQYKRRKFWRVCLERKNKRNVGYNAILTKVGRAFKGLIWLDVASENYDKKELAEKVKKHFKIR